MKKIALGAGDELRLTAREDMVIEYTTTAKTPLLFRKKKWKIKELLREKERLETENRELREELLDYEEHY
jgi:cell shape-determining protein MreC